MTVGTPTVTIFGQGLIDQLTTTSHRQRLDGGEPVHAGRRRSLRHEPSAGRPHHRRLATPFPDDTDEHADTLAVSTAGTFDYAYRFRIDGGVTYLYCGADDGDPYDPADAGDPIVD